MRVRFGPGTFSELSVELDELGLCNVLVLSTPGQVDLAERVAAQIGDRAAGVHAEARMHVPVEVAREAERVARELNADGCVAVGGGSTVGLAKAVALSMGLPIVAVPTTYAGSEMTPVWGLTDADGKTTGKDAIVLPRSVIYDVELTASLPLRMTVESGLNAMAHAVEALYAPDRSPVISLLAEESVRAMATALRRIAAGEDDVEARSSALRGAWLAGACLGATKMGLHHKLCHTLGGQLDLPHAATHAILLPHVLAFNVEAAPDAAEAIARALGVANAVDGMFELVGQVGAPQRLDQLGVTQDQLDMLSMRATEAAYANPRPFGREDVLSILEGALHGGRPSSVSKRT